MLVCTDLFALTIAFAWSESVFGADASGRLRLLAEAAVFVAALPVWVAAARLAGLYMNDERRTNHSTVDELLEVIASVTFGTWLLLVVGRTTRLANPELGKLLFFWILAICLVTGGRIVARAIVRARRLGTERAIIVGAGYVGQLVSQKLANHPEYGIEVVGFVDAVPRLPPPGAARVETLGSTAALASIVAEHDVRRVLVAYSLTADEELLPAIRQLRRRGVRIDIIPRFFELVGPGVHIHDVEGLPVVGIPSLRLGADSSRVKRVLDLSVALLGVVLLAPVLVCVALLVALDSPGPVLYRHRRIGQNGRPFDLFKFRTMRIEYCRGDRYGGSAAEEAFQGLLDDAALREEFERSFKLASDPRVTRIGRTLRRTSLDELPQLLNVIRGDVSLVGPRPITEDELERYGDAADILLSVRPGITGYWQINGRSSVNYGERVRLDLAYLMDRSLGLDLKILARTPNSLRSRNGAC